MLFQAQFTLIGLPNSFVVPPIKAPIYISKSNLLQSENLGYLASFAFTCPRGLLNYVPETTIDEERP